MIVVSYNSHTDLHRCLPRYIQGGLDVIVVENGQFDESFASCPITYLHGHGNVGYGAAINLANKHLLDNTRKRYDWLICVNADAFPSHLLIETLRAGEGHQTLDLIGFQANGPTAGRRLLPTVRNQFRTAIQGESKAVAQANPADTYPIGAMIAIRTESFRKLGGFDERFFLYFEEVDLWKRALSSGMRVGYADSRLGYEHAGGGSTKHVARMAAFELGRSFALYHVKNMKAAHATPNLIIEIARRTALSARELSRGHRKDGPTSLSALYGLLLALLCPMLAYRKSRSNFPRHSNVQKHLQPSREGAAPRTIRPNALMVTFEDPRRGQSGSALRNLAVLDSLAPEFHVTCLVMSGSLAGPVNDDSATYVVGSQRSTFWTAVVSAATGTQWMTARYGTRRTRASLLPYLASADIVIASMINSNSIIVDAIQFGRVPGTVLIWDSQNFDPELWKLTARDSRGGRAFLARREARLCKRESERILPYTSAVVAVSERDKAAWQDFLGDTTKVATAPNGATSPWFELSTAATTPGLIVSFGSLGQSMTSDGLIDFLDEEWATVCDALPDVTLRLVGRDPSRTLAALVANSPKTTIIANPVDLIAHVQSAELFIFPQIRGFGSKLKLLEAIASGKPVVCSSAAVVGIPDHLLLNVVVVKTSWVDSIRAARARTLIPLSEEQRREVSTSEQVRCLKAIYRQCRSSETYGSLEAWLNSSSMDGQNDVEELHASRLHDDFEHERSVKGGHS